MAYLFHILVMITIYGVLALSYDLIGGTGEGKHQLVARRVDLRNTQFAGQVAGDAERVSAGGVVDDVAAVATRKTVTVVTRAAVQRVVAGAA